MYVGWTFLLQLSDWQSNVFEHAGKFCFEKKVWLTLSLASQDAALIGRT